MEAALIAIESAVAMEHHTAGKGFAGQPCKLPAPTTHGPPAEHVYPLPHERHRAGQDHSRARGQSFLHQCLGHWHHLQHDLPLRHHHYLSPPSVLQGPLRSSFRFALAEIADSLTCQCDRGPYNRRPLNLVGLAVVQAAIFTAGHADIA